MKKIKIKKVSEHDIQNAVIDFLKWRKDIYWFRNNSFSGQIKRPNGSTGYVKNDKKGSPDIICGYKGQWIGLEIKTDIGRQSPEQKKAEKEIEFARCQYFIIREDLSVLDIIFS